MNYLLTSLFFLSVVFGSALQAQDSTGIGGKPYQADARGTSSYLFSDWYTGSVRTDDDQMHDGVMLRYDLTRDEVEYRSGGSIYRADARVTEFNIPTGTDLYTFKNGYPAVAGQTDKSFYRLIYDGNTKLLKKYTKPIEIEKASATTEMDKDARLYILKNNKLNLVTLSDRNSFLKLLADEKNKMQYVIKEEMLDFSGEDDLLKLLEEYDSYKAGRGGN
ncbi:hypothetical protein HWI92_21020 [Dyadobacter sandarakinus]|uniref:DKNYY family protein n=2 Tax=Dyadobacter sandarakinus TaxID=2747268 RepID=A0ABX7IDT7_9BACT|nr:hypothetical protein HWI92_21020 [Dyadobacter sandarakinus]